ncbi:hypothetical protein CC1G_00786 [Coprinopsis cinerea okayama7|uniref:RING-type domain-containing protein n=1 Tax=Coprinopsis cinerea (strain Okayama-7 / 130 / ATCC MYA-4618 / FGSC 9003) TaxID=240176 RepID=A8N8R1_COPC7|nr:hypothetical protein CC1G_00786 [Coprinopsis cinerea okayama7\|eukprot:XP_001831239.2 hypothetical protein CC1G_00786 [Coprinopsis cinerea okayama7\
MSEPLSGHCSICLNDYNDPVCIPCGHVFCFPCLTEYANGPAHEGFTAPCPTCRADFHLLTPDPRALPAKYHPFISSHLRRLFFDLTPHEETVSLKRQVKKLKKEVAQLMDACERQMNRVAAHKEGERNLRHRLDKLQNDYDELATEHDELVGDLEEVKEERDALAEENARLRELLETAIERKDAIFEEKERLETKNEELEEEIELTTRRAEDYKAKYRQAKSQIQALQRAKEEAEASGSRRKSFLAPPRLFNYDDFNAAMEKERTARSGRPTPDNTLYPDDFLTQYLWETRAARQERDREVQEAESSSRAGSGQEQPQVYEPPARIRVKRPLPRRSTPMQVSSAGPQSSSSLPRKRPRLSEPARLSSSLVEAEPQVAEDDLSE